MARLKQSMLDAQKELRGLTPEEAIVRRFMVTDGKEVFMVEDPKLIVQLTKNGQLAFAFVLDTEDARQEVLENSQKGIAAAS